MTALPPEQEGRYQCPVCKRGFWSLSDKKHHMNGMHPKPRSKSGKRLKVRGTK